MKKIVSTLFVVITFSCNAQDNYLQKYLDTLVKKSYTNIFLLNDTIIQSKITGFNMKPSNAYKDFEKMTNERTYSDLVTLTKGDKPKYKIYGFWALLEKKRTETALEIIKENEDDSTKILFQGNCFEYEYDVYHLMLKLILEYSESKYVIINSVLSKKFKEELELYEYKKRKRLNKK